MFRSGSQVASGPAGVALRRAAVIVLRSRRGIRGRVVTRAAQSPSPRARSPRISPTTRTSRPRWSARRSRRSRLVPPAIDPSPARDPRSIDSSRWIGAWGEGTCVPEFPRAPSRVPAPRAPRHLRPRSARPFHLPGGCSPRNYTHPSLPPQTEADLKQKQAEARANQPAQQLPRHHRPAHRQHPAPEPLRSTRSTRRLRSSPSAVP